MSELTTYKNELLQALTIAKRIQMGDETAEEDLSNYLREQDYQLTRVVCILYWMGRDSTCIQTDCTYDYDKTCECYELTDWEEDRERFIEYLHSTAYLYTRILTGLDKLEVNIFE